MAPLEDILQHGLNDWFRTSFGLAGSETKLEQLLQDLLNYQMKKRVPASEHMTIPDYNAVVLAHGASVWHCESEDTGIKFTAFGSAQFAEHLHRHIDEVVLAFHEELETTRAKLWNGKVKPPTHIVTPYVQVKRKMDVYKLKFKCILVRV